MNEDETIVRAENGMIVARVKWNGEPGGPPEIIATYKVPTEQENMIQRLNWKLNGVKP
jgi:hypothetical protein